MEPLGKVRDRSVCTPELLQNAASSGVRERGERGIEAGPGILNHVVQYLTHGLAACKGRPSARRSPLLLPPPPLPPRDARGAPIGSPCPPRELAPRVHSGGDGAAAGATPDSLTALARRARRCIDPISDSPVVGRFPAPAPADSPRVMPETRCVLKNWGWWPGAPRIQRITSCFTMSFSD